mgnify:CR=1 FL=1|tara:strand:- start:47 stop:229 length:183 start_codon:yes stop_codon:yes gene_type:complete
MNDRKFSVKRVQTLNPEEQKKVDEPIKNEIKKKEGMSGEMFFFICSWFISFRNTCNSFFG